MTTAADYLWRQWVEDNLLHAVPATSTGDRFGLFDAACGTVLTPDDSTLIETPSGQPFCPDCLVYVGTQVEDTRWRP
ncbi:hypothetical protein [Goodfellowiella coeruleoviolacea]|uniref:Uncharacterized protein n=1 Tax=Goodfellowiella coeruleoviolacea TaxID=334858 RepID=A0AAE3GLG2_9PSEU|nr:hypothetical protein [Goodfellowiella coeruleoviolacea]MCP2168148.1 hypothetical protein [Goodfellowiella coeruleoviolacea]